jgi:hypothetical protein
MTQHVRTSYRKHRRATWGLAIALVLAVAAVVIPIASGAPEKTYTMLFPQSGAVSNPSAPVAGTAGAQTLCTNTSYGSVKLVISNTAKTASLGSADVTFPSSVVSSLGSPAFSGSVASGATITRSGLVVSARGLSLPSKTGSVTIQVPVTTKSVAAGPANITALVKQSNDFSDAGTNPDANTFAQPGSFPSLTTQNCDQKITGRVYHDRDQSGAFGTANPEPGTNDVPKQGWTVTLERNVGGTYTTVESDTTDENGMYEVTGQLGGTYRLCVTGPGSSDPDSGVAWAVRTLTTPSYWTATTGCPDITATSPDSRGVAIASLTTTNAINEDFAVVPVTVFDFDKNDTAGSGNYVVTAGGDSTKDPAHYTQETFTDSNGHPFFIFAPINSCTGCGKIYLLEHLQGTVAQSALGADKQIKLVYDDFEPFVNFSPMPYCLQDPRGASATDLLTSNVLPSGTTVDGKPITSCIVEGHQTVVGDGTAANANIDFEFFVYSSYDGLRTGH